MKKFFNLLLFVLICPTLSALGAQGLPAACSNAQTSYNPDIPFGHYASTQQDSSLSLNSGLFGMNGPLSIGTEYSEDYGVTLNAQYTQKLGNENAVSLLLSGGAKQRRINATWAHILTQNQRIKVSFDRLSQKMQFDFDSGDSNQWVDQNAYGVSYQYIFPKGWLNDINLNAFYSQADSKNLSSVFFTQNGATYENFRRIAGGTEKSFTAGIDLLPTSTTELGLNLNYSDIHYDMKYSEHSDNSSGLGYSITLNQLINKKIKLNLVTSDEEAARTYGGGISLLLPSEPGTSLELDLSAQRSLGGSGLPNNTTDGANVDFSWGGNDNTPNVFTLQRSSAGDDLAAWAATPAVKMAQVLAVADQKSVLVNSSLVSSSGKPIALAAGNTLNYVVYVNPDNPVAINTQQYTHVNTSDSASSQPDNDYAYKAEGLPGSLQFSSAKQTITGSLNKGFSSFVVVLAPQVTNTTA